MNISAAALPVLNQTCTVPAYDRAAVTCGIVHMSVGGFHRSHQAVYIDDVLHQPGNASWGICGVGLLPQDADNIHALQRQDGLYAVLQRSADKDDVRIIGSMIEALHAPGNEAVVFERLLSADTRILSLTVTEKGYCYDSAGNLDEKNPAVVHDVSNPDTPKTALGYAVYALQQRMQRGLAPFTVMSCDNLPGNGALTRKLILQFAALVCADTAAWIAEHVSFPNAMVDRITPVTDADVITALKNNFDIDDAWPVVCEDYREWVLEDDFVAGRPALETCGVQLVKDVHPYEMMKVRLLNGSHSALSYLSYLLGHRQVDAAMADADVSGFIRAYMDEEVTPSLAPVPGIDLSAYKDTLIRRFSNPRISDAVQRLAEDGSRKIPNAILPCVRYQLEKGGSIRFATLALAAWCVYAQGTDDKGRNITLKDPLADTLSSNATAGCFLNITEIFGSDLRHNTRFVDAFNAGVKAITDHGMRAALNAALKTA